MASSRNFIVVGATRGLVLHVLLALHTFTDAHCVVVCAKRTRFLRFSKLVSEYLEVDFLGQDDENFIDSINRFSEDMPDLVLIPADCDGARMTSRVRNRLKAAIIPAPDSSMLDCFNNKWLFYKFCKEHGINVPATRYVGNKHDLAFASTVLEVGIPFVIKPLSEAGSQGVQVISSEEDYHQEILNNDAYQHAPLIAQSYIKGTDVGLNVLSIKGKVAAIAIQQRDYPQHEAAKIKFINNSYLESVAHTLSGKSGYDGVMNIDARIEDGTDRVFLFECNPRFWRSLLASAWCGLNFVGEAVESLQHSETIRTLTTGSADTFYHPLFHPSLWRYAIFDQGHRGRMVRAMINDVCFLGSSIVFAANAQRRPPAVVSARRNAAT